MCTFYSEKNNFPSVDRKRGKSGQTITALKTTIAIDDKINYRVYLICDLSIKTNIEKGQDTDAWDFRLENYRSIW